MAKFELKQQTSAKMTQLQLKRQNQSSTSKTQAETTKFELKQQSHTKTANLQAKKEKNKFVQTTM